MTIFFFLISYFKVPMTQNFLFRKYLAYHTYKPIPKEEKFQKFQNTVFSGPKVLLICLKVSCGLVTN